MTASQLVIHDQLVAVTLRGFAGGRYDGGSWPVGEVPAIVAAWGRLGWLRPTPADLVTVEIQYRGELERPPADTAEAVVYRLGALESAVRELPRWGR